MSHTNISLNTIIKANLIRIALRINGDGFNSIRKMFERKNQIAVDMSKTTNHLL